MMLSACFRFYATQNGNSLPPFRDNPSVEDGTDRLSQNVGTEFPLLTV